MKTTIKARKKSRPKASAHRNGSPTPMSPFDILTLEQAARYLQLPIETVQTEAESGRLGGRKFGEEWRFVRYQLTREMQSRPREALISDFRPESDREEEVFLDSIREFREDIDRLRYAQ
jgi:excisionase family DNA binding protein